MGGDIGEVMGGSFDANSVDPTTEFAPIEPGWYTLQIEKAEVKPTKKQDGKVLAIQFCVLGDKHNNRKVFKRINIKNPSSQCEEIGLRDLAGLTLACGMATLSDSSELFDKIIEGKVVIKKEEGREPDNDIQAFRPCGAAGSAPTTAKPQQTASKSAPRTSPAQTAATPAPAKETAAPAKTAAPGAKPKRPWDR